MCKLFLPSVDTAINTDFWFMTTFIRLSRYRNFLILSRLCTELIFHSMGNNGSYKLLKKENIEDEIIFNIYDEGKK